MSILKHKVFISFKYEDVAYKDKLIRLNERFNLFEDWHAGEGQIISENMTHEQVRITLRDDFIKQSSVLILLCGDNMRESKYVDWELFAAMSDYEGHPSTGILVITLPTSPKSWVHNSTGLVRDIYDAKNGASEWVQSLKDFDEANERWSNMPIRIVDNLIKNDVKIDIINWNDLNLTNPSYNDVNNFKLLIDKSFNNRKQKYNIWRPLKDRK